MGKNTSHKKKSKKDKKRKKNKKVKYSSDEESESIVSYTSSSISKSKEKAKKKKSKKTKKKSDSSSLTSSLSDEVSTSKNKEVQKFSEEKKEGKDVNNVQNSSKIVEEDKKGVENEEPKCTDIALRDEDNNNVEQRIVDVRSNFIKLNYQDLPNFHKKLIIYNLPPRVNDDEIKNYVLTLLTTLNPLQRDTNPINSFQKMEEGLYYIFELMLKDDIDILINLDQTDWRGYRIRIQKPKRFYTDYNDTEGGNVRKRENKKLNNYMLDSDNKLYMGGIPVTAKDDEVRRVVEAFGQIKTFNLVKDSNDDNLNRGFCFFEYLDEKVTERAIKGLNNLEMGDRRLRVQRASFGSNTGTIAAQQKAAVNTQESAKATGKSNFSDFVPTINPADQIDVPLYASLPSRVIQIINVICPEDVMDDLEYREIVEDIRNECLQFGTVLNVEIPRPDKSTSIAGPAVGKVFLKFATLQAAKKARYRLSGRKYNRRTIVASFYPEHYFDVREFNFHER